MQLSATGSLILKQHPSLRGRLTAPGAVVAAPPRLGCRWQSALRPSGSSRAHIRDSHTTHASDSSADRHGETSTSGRGEEGTTPHPTTRLTHAADRPADSSHAGPESSSNGANGASPSSSSSSSSSPGSADAATAADDRGAAAAAAAAAAGDSGGSSSRHGSAPSFMRAAADLQRLDAGGLRDEWQQSQFVDYDHLQLPEDDEEVEDEEAAEEEEDEEEEEALEVVTPTTMDSELPSLPLRDTIVATIAYTVLAAAYVAAGLAAAYQVLTSPRTLFTAAGHSDVGVVLAGCLAGMALRCAGMCLFLREGAVEDDLVTWRVQRVNLALLLASALTALSLALGANALSGQLLAVALPLSLTTLAACLFVARAVLRTGPLIVFSPFTWDDPSGNVAILRSYLLRDVSSLASGALLLLLATHLWGAGGTAVSGGGSDAAYEAASAAAADFGPAGAAAAAAAVTALRRAVGCGMALVAVSAHSLLDFAGGVGSTTPSLALQAQIESGLRSQDPLFSRELLPAYRFTWLNVGFIVSGLMQFAFAYWAPELGVDVNTDARLWAPLFWGGLLTAAYAVVALLQTDWRDIADAALNACAVVAAAVSWMFSTFVSHKEWNDKTRIA